MLDEKNQRTLKKIKRNLEIGEEIADFKEQLKGMKDTLKQAQSPADSEQKNQSYEIQPQTNRTLNTLMQEIQDFNTQVQNQKKQIDQELQQSIQQITNTLNQSNEEFQIQHMATKITQRISEIEKEFR